MNSIKQIEVFLAARLVSRKALANEGLCVYLNMLPIGLVWFSPFLPLNCLCEEVGVFIAKPRPFEGGFDVFNDCWPDGWGRLILDHDLQQKEINPRAGGIVGAWSLGVPPRS